MLSQWVVNLSLPPLGVLVLDYDYLFHLGLFSGFIIYNDYYTPDSLPIILKLGFDPFGLEYYRYKTWKLPQLRSIRDELFILKGLLPDTGMGEIFQGAMWFVVPIGGGLWRSI